MTARDAALVALRKERRAIVRTLKKNGANVKLTARQLGVDPDLVRWLRDVHRLPVNRFGGPRVTGTREIERAAVAEWLDRTGGNVKRTSRETGVPESTVRRWKADAEA